MKELCPTSLALAQFAAEGDASPKATVIRTHTAACASCKTILADLEADRRAFLVKHPFTAFWNDLEKRIPARPPFFSRLFRWLNESSALRATIAMAGLATIMIVAVGRETALPQILTKGGVDLQFYVASSKSGGPALGKSGMKLPEGSGLQFVYSAQEPYLLLIGIEADRTVSVYHPSNGSESVSIEIGDRKKLPQAIRWQPKSAYERFYGVFSKQPVKMEEIRNALETPSISGKSIEQIEKLPLPYPQSSAIIYRSAH
jgi:hypothetical protein